jgi:hypothetical protein
MQMPLRQQSKRVSDITPPKRMDESACRKELTTYSAHTIRKQPANPGEKPTWAKAEIIDERLSQDEIKREIKRLDAGKKTLTEKKTALANFQQGQIATLLDDIQSTDPERQFFERSLVQLDRTEREIPTEKGQKRKYETATMTIFVKRTPAQGIHPVALFQDLPKIRAERMRPPPPPPQPEYHPEDHEPEIIKIHDEDDHGGHGGRPRKLKSVKGQGKKYHHDRRSESSGSSSRSGDLDSESSYSGESDSLDTTISSSSTNYKRSRKYHSRGGRQERSHSRNRPSPIRYYLESQQPDRRPNAYGIPQQPYAPEAPRALPQLPIGPPPVDPITTAYLTGKEDGIAERFGSARSPPPPVVERVIERVIEPRAVVSYGRPEPRMLDRELREREERYRDELRREETELRRRDAEDYIDRTRPLPSVNYIGGDFRASEQLREPLRRTYPDRRPEPSYYDEPIMRRPLPTPTARSPPPFAPTPLSATRRRFSYAPSTFGSDSSGW